jgi:DNA-binding FadR family transcriptional regulator
MPKLNIRLNSRTGETKTEQIFNQISSAILSGKFNPGDTIISERALCEQLGVSRKVVRGAYRRLEEEGLIETHGTSGRRVRERGRKGAKAASKRGRKVTAKRATR